MPKQRKKKNKLLGWSRLDNAAKIFPPTAHGANTGVFRLSCQLKDAVEPALLQQALQQVAPRFPHMLMVMRRGVFWYYLEQSDQPPRVVPEYKVPCAPLYRDSQSNLFEVSYWRCKINLEVYHVLADGSGAIAFFQALLSEYLFLTHPFLEREPLRAAPTQRAADSFQKYYQPHAGSRGGKKRHAYRLHGAKRADGDLNILEGICDVRQALDAAHRYHTTLTVFLTALLFTAIHGGMYVRHEKKPVTLTVPVDLRGYFPSDTARNFFGTMRVSYDFSKRLGTFEDIIEHTAAGFRRELTPERIAGRMNTMASLEHNPVIRPIPLLIKNWVLRLSGSLDRMNETAVISNIGRFALPEALHAYVEGFSAFMSTNGLQLVTCTFDNSLHLGFTSAFVDTELQRRFFALLTEEGIELTICSSEYQEEAH